MKFHRYISHGYESYSVPPCGKRFMDGSMPPKASKHKLVQHSSQPLNLHQKTRDIFWLFERPFEHKIENCCKHPDNALVLKGARQQRRWLSFHFLTQDSFCSSTRSCMISIVASYESWHQILSEKIHNEIGDSICLSINFSHSHEGISPEILFLVLRH